MPSLNKLTKKHPEKKNAGPAVRKGSHTSGVSPADRKKMNITKGSGKAGPQPKIKSVPAVKAKTPQKPAPPAAAKKQPARAKPVAKAAQPARKKQTPIVKAKPSKKPAPPAAAKKQPAKAKPAVKTAQPARTKQAPAVKAKPSKKPAPPVAAKKQPAKAKPAAKTAQPARTKQAPAAKAKPSTKPAPPVAAKKQPAKAKPAVKTAQPARTKQAPAVKAKPSKKPSPPVTAKKQPAKAKPAGKAEKPPLKKASPAAEEQPYKATVISFEVDQLSAGKDVVVAEKIQAQGITVFPGVLGKRYKCYKCDTKFYDLGKPQPLCPSCGANQLDAVVKAARKRKGRQRSAFAAKTEPHAVAPGESEDLHEVVNELDAEFVLDVDDIVLEEHEDSEDKE